MISREPRRLRTVVPRTALRQKYVTTPTDRAYVSKMLASAEVAASHTVGCTFRDQLEVGLPLLIVKTMIAATTPALPESDGPFSRTKP